jgi:hypothetical protein
MTVMDEQEIEQAREAVQRSLDWQDDSAREKSAQEKAKDAR